MKKEMLGKIAIVAACIMLAVFTSCKKDDDNNSSSSGGGTGGNTGGGGTGGGGTGGGSSYVAKAFSVSPTKKVKFSQGNLQYQASTGTWRFAENQYDCIGEANSNISSTYSGWIDLFGWGTSGWNSEAVCYQPYSTSTSYTDYYPGGSYTNNLTGTYANADWGVYNAISNGGNQAGMWRTLSNEEWHYMIDGRSDSDYLYGLGKVNGINGLIILPDSWMLPSDMSFISGEDDGFMANQYALSEWAIMEQSGAVFLPAAGHRDSTSVSYFGTYGCYWSSSYYFIQEDLAHSIHFYSESVNPSGLNMSPRYIGLSVRLVADY